MHTGAGDRLLAAPCSRRSAFFRATEARFRLPVSDRHTHVPLWPAASRVAVSRRSSQGRRAARSRCGCGGTGRRRSLAMRGAKARGSSSLPTRTLALDSAVGRAQVTCAHCRCSAWFGHARGVAGKTCDPSTFPASARPHPPPVAGARRAVACRTCSLPPVPHLCVCASVRLSVRCSLFSQSQLVYRGGAVAQLGEHLVCNQGVEGSNPFRSIRLPAHPTRLRATDRVSKRGDDDARMPSRGVVS